MYLEEFIKEMNENHKINSSKEYNLGNLIKDLEKYKEDFLEVEFDDGTIPENFESWRGNYCELALSFKDEGICHSSSLYRKAFNTNGSMFVGYKGGDFIMDLDTPIHQANYGETGIFDDDGNYNCKKIIGMEKKNNKLIIKTRIDED